MRRLTPSTTGRRLAAVVATASAAVGLTVAAPAALLTSASADGIFPSTTTVSASPSTATVGQSVTLTAQVGITGLGGAGVTPTGSVSFSTGSTSLGSAPLNTCFLTACTATLSTTALPRGTDVVTASYHTDGIVGSSSGTTTVQVNQVATPSTPYVQTCAAGQPCDTGTLYADDGSSNLDVTATASRTQDTITAYLGGSALPCTTPNTGEAANYTVTSTDVSKTSTYDIEGTYADNFNAAHPTSNPPHVCWESTIDFSGYYPSNGKWTDTSSDYSGGVRTVPYNSSLKAYVGLLPACNSQKSNSPCVVSQTFGAGQGTGGGDQETFVVYEAFKQYCDPKFTP